MAFVDAGYDGTVDESQFARLLYRYAVVGADDFKASNVAGADRTLSIANGTALGPGSLNVGTAFSPIQFDAVTSGTMRWDLVVLRRDWQPPGGNTSIVIIKGGATQVLPARNQNPGVIDDQPLYLQQVNAGSTSLGLRIDLRVWVGAGGAEAADKLALTYLAQPGAAVKVGEDTHRYEYTPTNGGSFGWKAYPNPKLVHLELDFRAPRNLAGELWGPGSPAQMAAGVNQTSSSNAGQFSFPLNNEVRVTNAGVYALSWSATGFDKPTGALMLISRDANSQILASNSIGDGSRDISASRASIYLPAGAVIQFNFTTGAAVTCRHLLTITKLG